MHILPWVITASKVIFHLLSLESGLAWCAWLSVCDTLFHLSCTPMVKTFSPHARTQNGTTSFEYPEYFGEVQTDEKSEMMLKRVSDTAMRWCVCATLYLQSVNDSHVSFPGVKQKKKGVYNIMFFFLGKPHFLLSVVGCRRKKVTEKTRGDERPESKVRKERSSLMKQENTTGAGSRWVAASLVLWGVCC